MKSNKRIIGLLALGICVCFTVLLFFKLYLPNWNALYQVQQVNVETKSQMLGITLGDYSSKEEALRVNSIKEYKEWSNDEDIYILGAEVKYADVTKDRLILYKFHSNSLVQLPNSIFCELDIKEPGYDRFWYDGQFTDEVVKIWLYFDYSMIPGDEKDIYYGLWIGNGIEELTVSTGNLKY